MMYKTYKKKIKLDKVSRKIKRLVEKHGSVKLEMYHAGRNGRPYGMRYLKKNGDAKIHYCDWAGGFNGRGKQDCCFFEDYSVYRNEDGDEIIKKSISDTLRAMQQHDKRGTRYNYVVKRIHAGGRIINVKY